MAKRNMVIQYLILFILAVSIISIIIFILQRTQLNDDVKYSADLTVDNNPLMGYAPRADHVLLCEQANLVYILLTWEEWEPEDGVYDIAGLENRFHIERWRSEGKHAVIRFVCDIPGNADHIDIPGWLYDKTGNGIHYNNSCGMGYSPDYSDKTFREYHDRALRALADYCNRDGFVSFVQLGSLGHWGEWHATSNVGTSIMPDEQICAEYASVYSESFTNALLMTRRNYSFAVDNGMGFFNDMIGAESDSATWLDWLENGGVQHTEGNDLILKPVGNWGRTEPVGGELTSSVPMDVLMGDGIGTVLETVSRSGQTFIGPMVPGLTNEDYSEAVESVLRRMGYRIYVSNLRTRYDFASSMLDLHLTFRNAADAGFFFDWPVYVCVYDKDLNLTSRQELSIDLRDLNTADMLNTTAQLPIDDELRKEYYLGIEIKDPDFDKRVMLAIDTEEDLMSDDGVQIIYHYVK